MNTKDLLEIATVKKNETAKHCWEADHNFSWDQKKVVDMESRLIPRKVKETIHYLKNPNHINKISHTFPAIWLPNLRQFLDTYLCGIRRILTNQADATFGSQSFVV